MDLSKLTVLIVDDVAENIKVAMETLKLVGCELVYATSGIQALERATNTMPDLILLDIMMPDMDGFTVCKVLKAEKKTQNIPIIFLSAKSGTDNIIKGFELGAVDYISKPFRAEELKARVLTHLKLHNYEKNLVTMVDEATSEITNLNKTITDTQVELMFGLGNIAESHSKETSLHVKRVSEYSYLLAKVYGFDEEKSTMIKNASSLHDIGKLSTPDYILTKPAKLDAEEWEIMKTHAQNGSDMLSKSEWPLFQLSATICAQHHEHYDGTGYPLKLKGEDISIYARIVAIADVFDALSNKRVYKDGWSVEKVIDHMKNNKGTHFDPKLIDLFLENIIEILEIRDKYKNQ